MPWRHALVDQWRQAAAARQQREDASTVPVRDLAALRPAINAARRAWQPYQERLDSLEEQLRSELRPAMRGADDAKTHAGFGHRRNASRQAELAAAAVRDAEARLAALTEQGAPARGRLDALLEQAAPLRHTAEPSRVLLDSEQSHIQHLERCIDALDAWTGWNAGQSVDSEALLDALDALRGEANSAARLATRPGVLTRHDLDHLSAPLADWLCERRLVVPTPPRGGPGLGLEL